MSEAEEKAITLKIGPKLAITIITTVFGIGIPIYGKLSGIAEDVATMRRESQRYWTVDDAQAQRDAVQIGNPSLKLPDPMRIFYDRRQQRLGQGQN